MGDEISPGNPTGENNVGCIVGNHDIYYTLTILYNKSINNTWTWTGVVDGKTVSVSCPKLSWEK